VTLWRTFLVVLWCAVFVCAAILVGEYTGLLNSTTVGQVIAFMPIRLGTGPLRSVAGTPTPAPAEALSTPTTEPAAETCTPGQPIFVHGTATLKAALGPMMGDPLECERVIDAVGDTEQRTTTGLAYYRTSTNAVAFTNGFDHWALAGRGVVHWTGDAVDPPPSAETVG
jgi:hypothetical protein